jgi:hypothetical protein
MTSPTEPLTIDEVLQETPAERLRSAVQILRAYVTADFVAPGAEALAPPLVGVLQGDLEFALEVLREQLELPERTALANRLDAVARRFSFNGEPDEATVKHRLRELVAALGGTGEPAARA